MEQVVATIVNGSVVLAEDVTAWVRVATAPNGMKSWSGSFSLTGGSDIPPGGPYLFRTADGRAGQIIVNRVGVGSSGGGRVEFVGTGPFGRAS